MREQNKELLKTKILEFNDRIDNLSKNSKGVLNKIKISLKNTTQYIKDDTCPFDLNLGKTLDEVVKFANKHKITSGAQIEFQGLVESHLNNITDTNAKDKSFMSAKKLLTHIKKLKNLIISKKSNNSPSSSSSKVAKKQMISPDVLIEYLDIVIDLLKVEKYRLTDKVTVRDSETLYYSQFDPYANVNSQPLQKQVIQYILSDNFQPKESDIRQGMIQDCYLLAALKSIARENPNAIKKCFVADKNDGLIVRFYKVLAETVIEEDNKVKTTTKANGRVMIKMDKSIFVDLTKGQIYGNNPFDPSGYWVNLMEKAYAIYRVKGNIKDQDYNFFKATNFTIENYITINNLSMVEFGFGFIPTTAITGKKGFGIVIPNTNKAPGNHDNSGNSTTSQSQTVKESNIDPSTILGIIEEAIKEGKSVTSGTFTGDYNGWNSSVYCPITLQKGFLPGHEYSVKGIEEVRGNKYIVLSDPYMNFPGIMITDDVLSYYGNKGDVYLTPKNFSKYIRNYNINKLKRKKR